MKLKRVFSGGPDQVVGKDTTDSHGRWRITPQGSAGISLAHFYARVRRQSQGAAGTIFVCRGDRSRTVGANSRGLAALAKRPRADPQQRADALPQGLGPLAVSPVEQPGGGAQGVPEAAVIRETTRGRGSAPAPR